MLTLRPFRPEDDEVLISWVRSPEELFLFAGSSLRWPLTARQLNDVRRAPGARAWTGVDEHDEPVGHAELWRQSDGRARLALVLFAPEQRGRGYGRALLAAILDQARELDYPGVELAVYSGNDLARQLYASLGFEHRGPSSEQHGLDRMTMSLDSHARP
jgi:RimJ/RimL family protein N-acetyltransferase